MDGCGDDGDDRAHDRADACDNGGDGEEGVDEGANAEDDCDDDGHSDDKVRCGSGTMVRVVFRFTQCFANCYMCCLEGAYIQVCVI